MTPFKPAITHDGQRYYHEAVRREIRPLPEFTTALAWSLKEAYGMWLPALLYVVVGYEKVQLNWLR